eukprot:COSAG06_NODE_63669_length_261_cov_1.734568_1_plen_38_part_01
MTKPLAFLLVCLANPLLLSKTGTASNSMILYKVCIVDF